MWNCSIFLFSSLFRLTSADRSSPGNVPRAACIKRAERKVIWCHGAWLALGIARVFLLLRAPIKPGWFIQSARPRERNLSTARVKPSKNHYTKEYLQTWPQWWWWQRCSYLTVREGFFSFVCFLMMMRVVLGNHFVQCHSVDVPLAWRTTAPERPVDTPLKLLFTEGCCYRVILIGQKILIDSSTALNNACCYR